MMYLIEPAARMWAAGDASSAQPLLLEVAHGGPRFHVAGGVASIGPWDV